MMDNIREKLVELLLDAEEKASERGFFNCYQDNKMKAEFVADHLLAHGVTVQEQGFWTENQHISYDDMREEDVYWYTYACSVCGGEAMNNYSYCPFCGNLMLPQPPKGE